jgi:hypothetical protein
MALQGFERNCIDKALFELMTRKSPDFVMQDGKADLSVTETWSTSTKSELGYLRIGRLI